MDDVKGTMLNVQHGQCHGLSSFFWAIVIVNIGILVVEFQIATKSWNTWRRLLTKSSGVRILHRPALQQRTGIVVFDGGNGFLISQEMFRRKLALCATFCALLSFKL